MGKYSYSLIICVFLISFFLWLFGKESLQFFIDTPMKAIIQFAAIIGATGYLLTFFFSSRLPIIEKINIPLDKSYKLHRLIGTLAGAGILLHVSALIANLLPSSIGLTLYLLPGSHLAYTFGTLSFYAILIIILTTFYTKLPYHIWKFIHQMTGVSVIFAVLHIFLISSDVSTNLFLRVWMLGLCGLALVSWFYKLFIYPFVAFRGKYLITDVTRNESVLLITMQAINNGINASPGQFAFFSFEAHNKVVTRESHPFTVLRSTQDTITIAVKYLGDHTFKFQQLTAGDEVKVAGPYGGFGKGFIESQNDAVWIAGGIGVTPFVNLLTYAQVQQLHKRVTFYYSTRENDQVFHPQIQQDVASLPIDYHYISSESQGRISPEKMVANLEKTPGEYDYFVCGPKGLLVSVMEYLTKIGVPQSQIYLEDFDFKDLEV